MVPYGAHEPTGTTEEAAGAFAELMSRRRSVRDFSDRPVSEATVREIVAAAASAPSGAHKQPWRFVCVQDPELKRAIREAAENEERLFYGGRAPKRWLEDLHPFGTDAHKPFLETAPWLIVVFKLTRGDEGDQVYYVNESVGIATGLLLAAVHHAGLVALTHTPSPMGFLREVLQRPAHEKPFLLIPIGHPADCCMVPAIERKALGEVMIIDRG
jgi:nitroreductase